MIFKPIVESTADSDSLDLPLPVNVQDELILEQSHNLMHNVPPHYHYQDLVPPDIPGTIFSDDGIPVEEDEDDMNDNDNDNDDDEVDLDDDDDNKKEVGNNEGKGNGEGKRSADHYVHTHNIVDSFPSDQLLVVEYESDVYQGEWMAGNMHGSGVYVFGNPLQSHTQTEAETETEADAHIHTHTHLYGEADTSRSDYKENSDDDTDKDMSDRVNSGTVRGTVPVTTAIPLFEDPSPTKRDSKGVGLATSLSLKQQQKQQQLQQQQDKEKQKKEKREKKEKKERSRVEKYRKKTRLRAAAQDLVLPIG